MLLGREDSSVNIPHRTLWNVPSLKMLTYYGGGECQYEPLQKGQNSDLDNCIALKFMLQVNILISSLLEPHAAWLCVPMTHPRKNCTIP